MAKRPIFISSDINNDLQFFNSKMIEFNWYPGFAVSQKRKSIDSLHKNFITEFPERNVLEISTKSENPIGANLSAFNLKINHSKYGIMPLECAYQGGKIFEKNGQFIDMYSMNPYKIKKDIRLKESGRIIGFEFDSQEFDINPTGLFYNWIYIKALYENKILREELLKFSAFSDIEYNPTKSVNCQAKACALFVSLCRADLIDDAIKDVAIFKSIQKGVHKYDTIGYTNTQTALNL